MISLASLNGVTKTIKLGAGVVIVPLRDPVILAKQSAALDQFSNGRFLLGLGLGGSREEFVTVRPRCRGAHRGKMLDEKLDALELLLNGDGPVSYAGNYVEFESMELSPKPIQRPLPIYMAAHGDASLRRTAKYGLGPMLRDPETPEVLKALGPMLAEHSRTVSDIDFCVWADIRVDRNHNLAVKRYQESRLGYFRRDIPTVDLVQGHWIGTPEEIANRLVSLKRMGVEHFIVMHTATDDFQDMLEQSEIFAKEIIPVVEEA